jgi:ADP-ribose pyrophosphatase YjhB (NUDIX family)
LRAAFLARLAGAWRMLPESVQWRLLWLLNAKFTVGVSGVVFDDLGRVLLLEHTFRRRYPWGLVSGWVKAGEAPEAGLHREIAEETGLAIGVERLLAVRKDRFHLFLEVVYVCRFAGGTFRPSAEVTAVQWCDPAALPAGVHPHHAPLIRAAAMRWRAPPGAA